MQNLENRNIVKEMNESFIDYSMSVIIARALPDVRDGLKPVHRRIVYGMHKANNSASSPYKKSARIVGEVMGKYHPHGDSSIYDAMVRMAQDFSYRYPLVDGHGNFGSMDGDSAAASRYTEARMSKLSMELVRDINKNTVEFVPNYDGLEIEPNVLPSKFPTLLVNGAMGIAVGMATNIPPHNLKEVIDGIIEYIKNPDIEIMQLMEYIKGPDFPTGAIILGNNGIKNAYLTGKGSIKVRSKCEIIEKNNKHSIIVTEIPYLINKASLVQKIAELVRDKVIDGISDLRDESNRKGVKIVIVLKKEANVNVILNNLYKYSPLQSSFSCNMLAIVKGVPRVLNLKEMIHYYVEHQKEVIIKRSIYELKRSEDRIHIVEGFKIALDHIDAIIKIIRNSEGDHEAKERLKNEFSLTDLQAEAILEMKLRRLTGLEKDKVMSELEQLRKYIEELKLIISSEEKVLGIVKEQLLEIKNKYGDERRTFIDMTAIDEIEDESLIPVENIIVTLTNNGYIKRLPEDTYKSQNRGGVGVKGITTNNEDYVTRIVSCITHEHILFFTNKGKVYRVKGYEIPEFSRTSKGLPIVNLLPLEDGEIVNSILKINKEEEYKYIVFVTKAGLIKRTSLDKFENIRNSGKISITLKDNDELIAVRKSNGNSNIVIAANNGRMVHFDENEVRVMGRTASGVKGITLKNAECVGAEVVGETEEILIITEKGYGKRTPITEYRQTHRGSKGVKTVNITEKNGSIVSFKVVTCTEDLIISTNKGIIIRLDVEKISTLGRVTQGVRLINLKNDQKVSTVTTLEKIEAENQDNI
ncbi:MAG: DNA gyrase subunit A [Bacilli bacterium]